MNDIECPYCGAEQNIEHDDGQGYAEDEIHQQQCGECEKYFIFTTSIHYYYDAKKADCLNDSEHVFEPTTTYPVECTSMECTICGERRSPTKEEMEDILSKKK